MPASMVGRICIRTLIALLLAGLVACGDDDKPKPDGALPDAGADGALPDAGPDQAPPSPDGPVSACNAALDLQPLSLDPSWCVVHRLEAHGPADAMAYDGAKAWFYSLVSGSSGYTGGVLEYDVDGQAQKLVASPPVFLAFDAPGSKLYAGEYLARSAGGQLAVGYTADTTFDGQVLYGDKGIKTPKAVDKATGNYDVVFLSETDLLINGTGAGTAQDGQGVYLAQAGKAPWLLIKDLGSFSGHLALGTGVLYAGGYFNDGNKLYAFSLTEVQAAISGGTTLSAATDGDLVHSGGVLDAVALDDDSLVVARADANFAFEAVGQIPVTVSGDKVQAGQAKDLVTAGGNVLPKRLAAAGGKIALLLDDGAGKLELAVIEAK